VQSAQIYLDTIRECYEAFVIYSFFMYLMAYLEDEYGDISVYLSTKEEVPHMWGMQWVLKPWRMGDEFMWQNKKVRLCMVDSLVALMFLCRQTSSNDCRGRHQHTSSRAQDNIESHDTVSLEYGLLCISSCTCCKIFVLQSLI